MAWLETPATSCHKTPGDMLLGNNYRDLNNNSDIIDGVHELDVLVRWMVIYGER